MRVTLDAYELTGGHQVPRGTGNPVEGMHVGSMHKLLRVAVDLLRGQVAGEGGARSVLRPSEQMRFRLGGDDQTLRRVERPRVIPGQIEKVRRVGYHECGERAFPHLVPDPPQPIGVFRGVDRGELACHDSSNR